ncbi:DNA-binding transcriptional LysR family regulator [Parvibaculum indicum]|uniref:LysR family transcriptional regulator n=1 Tax=Parvibaculum indicum TaxID=562969 RepID=UPI00141F8998|nr:LysR family transcriptional regulator [Parvibaculum indicum]NIJ42528.1 DNA-binding transcriptional LysR family regulator [Parvibaculum indicum]
MNNEASWDAYRIFLAVAETQSLSAAGRRLRLSHATVGRHISALETQLGTKLFVREQTGYALTGAGERLRAEVEPMALAAERALHAANSADGEAQGLVRVAMPHSLACYWFMPYLGELAERHPGVEIELVNEISQVSVKRRDADVVIRPYGPGRENVVGRKIGRIGVGFYASKAYAETHGLPSRREEWKDHRIVSFGGVAAEVELAKWLAHVTEGGTTALRCVADADLVQAVRAGIGISTLVCITGDHYDDLIRIAPHKLANGTDMWLLAHPDLRDTAPVRAVLDFIAEKAKADRDRLSGKS